MKSTNGSYTVVCLPRSSITYISRKNGTPFCFMQTFKFSTSLLSYIVTKFFFQCLLKLMFLTVLHCLVICGAWVPLQNIASFFFFLLFHYERWLFFISRFHDILYNFVFLVNNTVRFWFHESFFLSFYSNKCNPATKRIRIELLLAPGNTYASNYIGKQLLENKIE